MIVVVTGTSIKSLVKQSPGAVVYRGQLMSKCVELCEVMQYEFIFTKTCQTLETAINEVMDTFLTADILVPQQVSVYFKAEWFDVTFSSYLEYNGGVDYTFYKINPHKDFFCFTVVHWWFWYSPLILFYNKESTQLIYTFKWSPTFTLWLGRVLFNNFGILRDESILDTTDS